LFLLRPNVLLALLHWNICLSHEEEEPAQWERRAQAHVQTNTHKARAHNHVYSHMCSEQQPQLAMALSAVHHLLMEHWPLNRLSEEFLQVCMKHHKQWHGIIQLQNHSPILPPPLLTVVKTVAAVVQERQGTMA